MIKEISLNSFSILLQNVRWLKIFDFDLNLRSIYTILRKNMFTTFHVGVDKKLYHWKHTICSRQIMGLKTCIESIELNAFFGWKLKIWQF